MLRAIAPLAALALSACFAPDPTTGAPCAVGVPEGERCPAGQICVQHAGVETCETMDIDPIAGDRDGDLVADAQDNCPDVANADQVNEDGDAAGDACDPCPPFAGVDDVDGDGVGDACDPNPTTPGDRLLAYTGFAAPLASPWTITGTLLVSGGEGIASANDNESITATIPAPASGRVEVRAAAQLLAVTANAPNLGAVNVVDRYLPNGDRGIACQLSALATGEQQQLRIFDLDRRLVVDTAPHPVAVGAELDLRLRRTNEQYSCRATNPVLELAGTARYMPASPRIGVRVLGATASFHWVMIVASP